MHADGSDRSSYSSRNVAAVQNQILNGHGNERRGIIRKIPAVDLISPTSIPGEKIPPSGSFAEIPACNNRAVSRGKVRQPYGNCLLGRGTGLAFLCFSP
jgi:hypothetical protein